MSKKPQTLYVGFTAVVVPSGSSRHVNVSKEVQKQIRSSYKDQHGGSSRNISKSYKAQEIVDTRTGQMRHKQEAKYTRTEKYVDKKQGVTTEIKRQYNVTKSVYPTKSSSSKSKNIRINYY